MSRRKTPQTQEELDSIESHLAVTLRRVTPPVEFIQSLRGRIQLQMPSRREISLRLKDWNRLFFVLGGVISGMLLLITLARAFYYLAARKSAV